MFSCQSLILGASEWLQRRENRHYCRICDTIREPSVYANGMVSHSVLFPERFTVKSKHDLIYKLN